MAEKTTSDQLEEHNKTIEEKCVELDGIIVDAPTYVQLVAFVMCCEELNVLLVQRSLLRAASRRRRSRHHAL